MTGGMERLTATPPGVKLCALGEIADGCARGMVLELRAGRFHGFVIRRGHDVYGYADLCPHAGLPLAKTLDDYLTADGQLIACSWHGALFQVETGACVGGPCVGRALGRWPVRIEGDWVITN
jgi:nitrite reductase/ring-hydroxylating ferredoxin subunit